MPGACREPPRRHEGELTVGPAVELRAGHAGDVPQLCVLAMHVYVATYCEGGLRPDQAREALEVYSVTDFQSRLQSGHTFTLACHGEHLLGFSETTPPVGEASVGLAITVGAGELKRLYVSPGSQGQGHGRALLRHAEQQAAAQGATGLWLSAWAGNARALAFYAAAGYREIGCTNYVFEDRAYENRVFFRAASRRGAESERSAGSASGRGSH